MSNFHTMLARWLAPEREELFDVKLLHLQKREKDLDMEVNQRVADYLSKMDPFEPLLKKYNVVFSQEYTRPEQKLNEQSQIQLFMWANGVESDPSFKHLINWFRDTQGNATLRKAKTDHEWLYGRAALATLTLFAEEVSRLSSRYKDILAERSGQTFDAGLPVE